MEELNEKYYLGFEEESEIDFILKTKDNVKKLVIWEGYFDEIMMGVKPDKEGFTSLARHYHTLTGWEEESPWKVDDPVAGLAQLKTIDTATMRKETRQVYDLICGMFEEAISKGINIYMDKD